MFFHILPCTTFYALRGHELQTLDLSCNQLSTLPRSIGNLGSLIALNVSSNDLEEFPRDIGKLSKLKRIDASFNRIKFFPCAVWDCTLLEEVNLQENDIRSIPSETALKLTHLQTLLLDGNPID